MNFKIITLVTSLVTSTLLAAQSPEASESSKTFVDSIGVNIGIANTSNSYDASNAPDETFNSIELYTTLNPIMDICKEYNMKPTLSYTYSNNDDLKHQYLLVGINKYYTPTPKLNLYAGIVAGYGQIDWRYDPLGDSTNKNTDVNSFIGGIQLGTSYDMTEKFSLNLNSKYLIHNYTTNIKTNTETTKIKQDNTATLSVGIGYRF